MTDSRSLAESQRTPVWVTRLSELIDRLYLVIRVNAVWWMLSLLGLLVLGVGPASCAASDAFIAARHGERVQVLPLMWRTYKANVVSANLRMLPLLVIQAGSLSMVWMMATGALEDPVPSAILGTLAAVSAGWATSSLVAIATSPRVRRQDLLVTWRLALLLPGVLLLRAIPMVVLLAVWLLLCSLMWPLALLLGAGVAINIAVALFAYRVRALLEDLHGRQGAAA